MRDLERREIVAERFEEEERFEEMFWREKKMGRMVKKKKEIPCNLKSLI